MKVTLDNKVLCDECNGTGERECDDGPHECIFCDGTGIFEVLKDEAAQREVRETS